MNKKAYVIPLILTVLIISGSFYFGWNAKTVFGIKDKKDSIQLRKYLEEGEYRGVKVYLYECYDAQLEEWGYQRNYTCKVNGFYDFGGTIFINTENKTNAIMTRTLFHEYGHYLWYKVFSSDEREEYEAISLSTGMYISEYALRGVHEDWAETYEAYMIGFEGIPDPKLSFITRMIKEHPEV